MLRKILMICLLSLLTLPASTLAQAAEKPPTELINDLVTFDPITSTYHYTPDTTGCPSGFVGKYSSSSRLTNTSSKILSDLFVKVITLTNGNLLQNADGGPGGVGATLTVQKRNAYTDGVLSTGEYVDVPFVLCLLQRTNFSFFVDVWGYKGEPPIADAGPDQTVYTGDKVVLDGSKSSDPDGNKLTFKWSFVSIPAGSTATLSDGAAVNPTFYTDRPGTYVIQLIVNNGKADSALDTVTVTAQTTNKPIADAGPDQTVNAGDKVVLDGSKSSDPDGNKLTFKWSFVGIPAGSTATLSDVAAVNPTFYADRPGTYVIQLIVNNGKADSALDTVTVTAQPTSEPIADAGPDQTVNAGDKVVLDGSKSSGAHSKPLTCRWSFTSIPGGSTARLSDTAAVKPTFVADLPGTYVVQLIVNNGTMDSLPDTVTIAAIVRGQSFILGEVYDDTLGLPLEGAEVKVVKIGNTIPDPVPAASTDTMGRFSISFQDKTGDALLEVRKEGYTKALRNATLVSNRSFQIFDARLTPGKAEMIQASTGGTVSSGDAYLLIPPLSLTQDTEVSLTPLSQQGIGFRLPHGWSPVYGVDISPWDIFLKLPATLTIRNIWSITPLYPPLIRGDKGQCC